MSTEVAVAPPQSGGDLLDASLKAAAEQAVKSGLFGKVSVWEAAAKISTGREIGISPMAAMGSLWIVSGRLVMSYSLLASLVQRSGRFRYRVTENSDKAARITFLEKVDGAWEEIGSSAFTIEMAKRANLLNKQPWQQYPEAMLFARALSQGVRMLRPSLTLMPAYVQGEIEADNSWNEPQQPAQPEKQRAVRSLSFDPASAPAVSKDDQLRATVSEILEANSK